MIKRCVVCGKLYYGNHNTGFCSKQCNDLHNEFKSFNNDNMYKIRTTKIVTIKKSVLKFE